MFASSPLSSAPSSHTQLPSNGAQQISQWRASRELPFEIQQYVRIYFEESLFTRALDLLLSVVTAEASSQRKELSLPPAEHVSLIATLVVHPYLTTRTISEEKQAEANTALRLLRFLLKTTGPINSGFKNAFRFRKLSDTVDDNETENVIKHPFANEEGIWNRVEDFWAVVGWTMNCSCLPDMHVARWEHWQLWVHFMIDVLEADWQYHLSTQEVDKSMLWDYMSHYPGDNAQPRRIVRAIFANGSKNSLNEFREVFKRELKGPKQESDKIKKREAVDIDKEIFGDYLVADDSDNSSDNEIHTTKRTNLRAPSARRITPRASKQSLHSEFSDDATPPPSTDLGLGPPNSITLRLQLMQLLIDVSFQPTLTRSRTTNFPGPTNLFTLFTEFIKPLPLNVFQQMTSPPNSMTKTLSPESHTTLLEFLLQRLLETSTSPSAIAEPLTQEQLQATYLPYAASKSSIDANARVSLCLEGLLRNLTNRGLLKKTEDLRRAVEEGIERRTAKVWDKVVRVKEGSDEEKAWEWFSESSARMRSVVRRLNT